MDAAALATGGSPASRSRGARLHDFAVASPQGSGPAVARLFHRLLALVLLGAWLSLGAQIHVLVGSRGLLPLGPFLEAARRDGLGFARFPTLLWWAPAGALDGALTAGVVLGVLLALAALAGLVPRLCFALSLPLYLGYAVACRAFCSFQWDNLLLESLLLAALLPRDGRARWAHFLLRCLLFKLYWESGIAKWQSALGDWQDGSAMTFYYETAPLPAWLAWHAHAMPASWHHLESWATLAFELVLPAAIFGPRAGRRFAAVVFTLFQVANAATANYGFFCHLAAVLHVFLLDDADVERAEAWLRARLRRRPAPSPVATIAPSPRRATLRLGGALACSTIFLGVSLVEGLAAFGGGGDWLERLAPLRQGYHAFRLINTYHLFASITRERIEPQFETFDGSAWREHDLRHKAGDPTRAPGYVAPHQPRVDFQLWFYGLSFRRGTPPWVTTLIDRMCRDPDAARPLFRAPLPSRAEAVRITFWRYHFTTPEERRATGAWWRREALGASAPRTCR